MHHSTESPSDHPKVLIVGAGPTGLSHAFALLRHGIPVRIIDKNVLPVPGQRGSGLHPRTFEILEALGVLDETWKLSRSAPELRFYKMPGGTEIAKEVQMIPRIDPTPDVPYPNARLMGQNHLEHVLADAIQSQYGCSVERGVELKSFEQQDDLHSVRVTLYRQSGETEESTYSYLIGADGGKSIVRKTLGLPFLGETREEHMFLGDFVMEGLDDDRVHVWGDMSDLSLMARPTEEPGLYTLHLGGLKLDEYTKAEDPEEAIRALLKPCVGGREDIKIKKTIWAGPFNIRMAPEFSKGRVFIVGDAAHVHSPTGAQGLNTGIHDSYNLAWKLALVLNNVASPSLLSTYSTERVPVVSEMLNITTQLMHKTFASTSPKDNGAFDRGGKLHLLGVNYRYSPIVVDGGEKNDSVQVSPYGGATGDHVRAGDRAPDATGLVPVYHDSHSAAAAAEGTSRATRLFKIFDLKWHTVLAFADNVDSFQIDSYQDLLAKYSSNLVRFVVVYRGGSAPGSLERSPMASSSNIQTFEDSQGHAYKAYHASDGASNVVVIRPDGYIGARAKVAADVVGYFSGIFDRL